MILRTEKDRAGAIARIEFLKLDKPMSVEIKPYVKNRSKAQNRLMWSWLTIISDDTGHTKEELHAELAYRYLEPLMITVEGEMIRLTRSTTALNVQEFTEYLNTIEGFATDLNIPLPHPEDLYYEAMGLMKGEGE